MGVICWMAPALTGALMGAMLVYPRQAADSVARALSDFAQGVLPGLLPFSACAPLLTAGRTLPVGLLTALALGAAAARMLGCAFPALSPGALATVQCLLEITSGMKSLISLSAPPLIAALTGFTGFAILLQNAAYWQKSGLTLGALTKIAILRGLLAFLVCAALELLPRL